MGKQRLAVVLFAAAFAAAAAGYLARPQRVVKEVLVVAQATQILNALLFVAAEQGYFLDEGLEVVTLPTDTGKAALAKVTAGQADVATVAEVPFVHAVLAGHDVKIFATIQLSDKDIGLTARIDSGIRTPADLAGKRIGFVVGTSSERFLDLFTRAHGLRDQVRMVPLDPAAMAEALANSEVDAISGWWTLRAQVEAKLPRATLTLSGEGLYTTAWTLVAPSGVIAQKPSALRKLMRALIRAEHFAVAHPERSIDITARDIRLDRAVVAQQWSDDSFMVRLDQALLVNLEGQVKQARRESAPRMLDHLEVGVLQAVDADRVTVFH